MPNSYNAEMTDYRVSPLSDVIERQHVLERLKRAPDLPGVRFSDDGATEIANPGSLRPAAVLVLIIDRRGEGGVPQVLFTLRTAHLTDHAGQISFPGGRVEASDRHAVDTALREAAEETGIHAHRVEVLGQLPEYTTGTGYRITPVVGWTEPPIEFVPDPLEVAECFEVPLSFLMDLQNYRAEKAMYKGRLRHFSAIPWQERYIWGATAGMLLSMAQIISQGNGLPD